MELEKSDKTNNSNKKSEYIGPSIYTKNAPIEKKKFTSSDDIENLLNDEKNAVKNEPWSRLQLSEKMIKLKDFSEIYCKEKNIDKIEELNLFLQDIFKRRTKKEVNYNKKTGIIEEITGLVYNEEINKFLILKTNKSN